MAALFVLSGCGGSDTPTTTQLSQRRISSAQTLPTPDVVDALFLGSGPLIPRDGQTQCAIPGTWVGFRRGTPVRVRVGAGVPAAAQAAIQRVAEQVGTATENVLTATVEADPDPNPTPGLNEVTVATVADPRREGCFTGSCLFRTFASRGALGSVRVIEPAGQVATGYAQDVVGAGVLGLCRIDARRIGGPGNSLMSGGSGIRPADAAPVLTGLDLAATQAVWASTASPGASRREFLSLGLVNIQVGERPRSTP
jgi:hypothetical protein